MDLAQLPSDFAAGTSVVYRKRYGDYPVADWDAKLILNGAVKKEFPATVDGDDFLFTLNASGTPPHTGELTAGLYSWVERVTAKTGSPAKVYDPAYGTVTVTPNLATATASEVQPWQERAIALLKARIEGRLQPGEDNEAIQLLGFAATKVSIRECHRMIRVLEDELFRLRNPGVLGIAVEVGYGRPA